MQLIFERGDRSAPVGHALIYFHDDNGDVLATYVSVPPIHFDLTSYLPGFLSGAMQGMDLGNAMVAAPMPPIPEEVASVEYLRALAERRADDLVFAGGLNRSNPMEMAAQTSEAAREYGEMYSGSQLPEAEAVPVPSVDSEASRYEGFTEQEKLNELTMLTGRLRDSLGSGAPDEAIAAQMRSLAGTLPAKYRVDDVIAAARIPGARGQQLAQLHLERCFKLFNEDYLDLERIDREIDAIGD